MEEQPENRPTTEALVELTTATFQVRRALVRRTGLTETELSTLEYLTAGPSSPSDIAKYLRVSTAASTGVVDRLEGRGHIERRAHPTDRRRTEVHITPAGQRDLDRQIAPMLTALTELDESLDEEQRAVVLAFLRRAVDAYSLVIEGD